MKLSSLYIILSTNALLVINLPQSQWNIQDDQRVNPDVPQSKQSCNGVLRQHLVDIKSLLFKLLRTLDKDSKRQERGANKNVALRPKWGPWTEWSPCSVTCGKGREIKWRHCLQGCDGIETEMEEKSCQLPACGGKLFGIIHL